MSKRALIASTLAAAVAAPNREECLRINGQQFVCRHVQSQRRSEGLDLRPRRLLRAHRQR